MEELSVLEKSSLKVDFKAKLREDLERLEKETEDIRREIERIENSFLLKIERSIFWIIFPWTTFVKMKRMRKIKEIEYQNREILEEYQDAKDRYVLSDIWLPN